MGKKIVVVNAGPRIGWNTDTLLSSAITALKEKGADVERFDLFKLDKYTGCVSCFGCKKEAHKGHCVLKDGLTNVLDAIRNADGLIIGSPNYLSNCTASFRALFERLIFQNLTYNVEKPCCNEKMIPVILLMTSNAPDTATMPIVEGYKGVFERFIGKAKTFVSGNTLQLKDYDKTDWKWTMFNVEDKKKRHEEVFPEEVKKFSNLALELL